MSAIHKCPHCQTVFSTSDGICPHCKKSINQAESTSAEQSLPKDAEGGAASQPSLDQMVKSAEESAAQVAAKYAPKVKPRKVEIDDDETAMFTIWWGVGGLITGIVWLLGMVFENNYYNEWQEALLTLAFVPMLIYGLILFKRRRTGIGWKVVFFIEIVLSLVPLLMDIHTGSVFGTIYMIEGIIAVIMIWIAIKS